MSIRLFILVLISCVLLVGCANNTSDILAKNDDFLIIRTDVGDSFASLAEQYLGDARYASVIQRYNPGMSANSSSQIAIPLKNMNRSGVHANGYQKVPVLCYHQFTSKEKGKSKMVVSAAEFEAQMTFLYENDYQVIPLIDLKPFLAGQKELPQKSVVITIDDGYKSYLDVALPILKKYDFHSTMFVYPEFVGAGPALKWRDVKMLSEHPLVSIQSHSKTHDSLSRRPSGDETDADYQKRIKLEVEGAEEILLRRTGNSVEHFAYPYGNSSAQLVTLLKQNDYSMALTVNAASNPAFASPFLLHRTMIYGGDSLGIFKKSLDTFNSVVLK